jgi:hypothetical protein
MNIATLNIRSSGIVSVYFADTKIHLLTSGESLSEALKNFFVGAKTAKLDLTEENTAFQIELDGKKVMEK